MYNSLVGLFEIEIEVVPQVWVKGYVKSMSEDSVLATFDNGLSTMKASFDTCRIPSSIETLDELLPGTEIEVLVELKEEKVKGWTKTIVDGIRGEFFTVRRLPISVTTKPAFVKEEYRLPSKNLPMSKRNAPRYHYCCLSVPSAIRDSAQKPENLKKLAMMCDSQVSLVFHDPQLTMISANSDDIKLILNLADLHFHFLYRENQIDNKIKILQAQISEEMTDTFIERIKVDSEYIKFVIGPKGSNIRQVRNMDGVVEVRVDDERGEVVIYGKDEESVARAREMLEYVGEEYVLKKNVARTVFGKNNENIGKVVDRTRVVNLSVKEFGNDEIVLKITGVRKAVKSAVAMIDFIHGRVRAIEELGA